MNFKRFLRIFSAACVLGLLAAAIPFTPVSAVGSIVLTPANGPPGTIIGITGSGYTIANGATTSFVVTSTSLGSTGGTVPGSGNINTSITVPISGIPRGIYSVTLTSGTVTNTANFTVTPQITLSAITGTVGTAITASGSGFASYASVSIYWDAQSTPIATATADITGSFASTTAASITIPEATRGIHTLVGADSGGATSPVNFTVNSKITITPASGGVGDSASIVGTGFSASNAVSITFDGGAVSTTPSSPQTNATGRFTATINIPQSARGSHTIQAQDSGGQASTLFSVGQKITLNPTSGSPGDTVGISGNGFSANQNLTIKIDGVALTTTPAVPSTDQTGFFQNVTFVIPGVVAGSHVISVTDQDGNAATATLTVVAKISITPGTGTVGTQITVSGSGFAPNAPVSIYWDAGTSPIANTTASSTGTITGLTFNAPASATGNHTVKAADTSANQATAIFATTSKIVLSPTTGGYNDIITVTFSGFAANSTIVSAGIQSGGTPYSITTTPTTVLTDANGGASATFTVAALYNGNWTIQVTDSGGHSATATLAVTPKVMLSAATGGAGDQVAATGAGFAPNKAITLKYNGAALATTPASVTSDSNGTFTCQFAVPPSVAGSIPLVATDASNNTATINFTATPKAAVSTATTQANPGNVGMDITVSGTGFKPSALITVTFESTPVTVATVNSDASGSFTATFKVPTALAGNHTIHATDGTTTKDFAFFMDSTAPAAVQLLAPADKFKPKQPIPFSWVDASDPSGITYTLQISQDPAFGTLILEKTGLTVTTYTMTEAEKLKSAGSKTPYYWRVRATDLAGNVGAWSTANTFTIGFIWPSWMIHVWYGLGIVLALIIGLWLGRRMAYQSY